MPSYSILFIGNSYTFYNDMPTALFAPFAEAAGVNVEVDSITAGGYTLAQHADPSNEYGARVKEALSGEKKYDFVILQEQSLRPATKTELFYKAVRELAVRIRESGAEPILYSTWGRKTGSSVLAENGFTNESMTYKLAAAYDEIGEELNIKVAHVGLAFFDRYSSESRIELYDSDKTHPSLAGSYLAAATIFARIFDINPVDVPFTASFSEKITDELREAARKAVFETPAIPE